MHMSSKFVFTLAYLPLRRTRLGSLVYVMNLIKTQSLFSFCKVNYTRYISDYTVHFDLE